MKKRKAGGAEVGAAWERALAEFAGKARAALGERLVRLVLYGSRARGDAAADSDVDLLAVVDGIAGDDARRVLWRLAVEAELRRPGVLLAVVVMTAAEWEAERDFSFPRAVRREGVPV
jgi:predicted nucleotidyltransferase